MLRLRTLGRIALERDASPVSAAVATRHRLALITILAVAGERGISREKLLGYLWSENDPERARRALAQALYALRRDLGDESIVLGTAELKLNPRLITSDVQDFHRAIAEGDLEQAVALYDGPFLDGFYLNEPELERWIDTERARLANIVASALRSLAEAAERIGDHHTAVDRWRRLVALDRLAAGPTIGLMKALAASGEHAAALRHFQSYDALIREELDCPPSVEVTALAAAFRDDVDRAMAELPTRQPPRIPTVPAVVSPDDTQPTQDTPHRSDVARVPSRKRRWTRVASLVAVGIAALLIAEGMRLVARAGSAEADPRRIALINFDALGAGAASDRSLSDFASALTQQLAAQLSGVSAITVVSSADLESCHVNRVSCDSVASQLQVGSFVRGSVQRDKERFRVTVDLLDSRSTLRKTETFESAPGSMLAIQDDFAERAAFSLRRSLGRAAKVRDAVRTGANKQAIDLAKRAARARDDAALIAEHGSPKDLAGAIATLWRADSLIAEAHKADPDWVQALIDRGWIAHDLSGLQPASQKLPRLQDGLAFAKEALRRDATNARALELRGVLTWGLVQLNQDIADTALIASAARDLRGAISGDSTLAMALRTLSFLLTITADFEESYLYAARAFAADTYLDAARDVMTQLFFSSLMRGDNRSAARWCAFGHRTLPGDFKFVQCQLTLMLYDRSLAPDPERAWRLVAELDSLNRPETAQEAGVTYPSIYRRVVAAVISVRAGDVARGRAELARARAAVATNRPLQLDLALDEAYLCYLLGERETAAQLFGEYFRARPLEKSYLLRDPLFRSTGLLERFE